VQPGLAAGSFDYPNMIVDQASNKYKDRIYITNHQSAVIGEEDINTSAAATLSRSINQGASVSNPTRLMSGNIALSTGNPVVTTEGIVIFPISEISKFGARQILDYPRLWVTRSLNGGHDLETPRLVRENHMASIPSLAIGTVNDKPDILVAAFANFEQKDYNVYSIYSENKITKAYYTNASDRKKAIDEIINIKDYKKFLEKSKYPQQINNQGMFIDELNCILI